MEEYIHKERQNVINRFSRISGHAEAIKKCMLMEKIVRIF